LLNFSARNVNGLITTPRNPKSFSKEEEVRIEKIL